MTVLGQRLGAGKEAEVFAYGEHVAKLYPTGVDDTQVRREDRHLRLAGAAGLPVPRVHEIRRFGDRWGIVMDRAPGAAFADAMLGGSGDVPAYLAEMARLHIAIHRHAGTGLEDMKARLSVRIARAEVLGAARQARLMEALATLPAGNRICHGDFHSFNIMGVPGAAMVIDWLDATSGPPAADVARTYLIITSRYPQLADDYINAYARSVTGKDDIRRWLPVLAGARVVEKVPDEMDGLLAIIDRA